MAFQVQQLTEEPIEVEHGQELPEARAMQLV